MYRGVFTTNILGVVTKKLMLRTRQKSWCALKKKKNSSIRFKITQSIGAIMKYFYEHPKKSWFRCPSSIVAVYLNKIFISLLFRSLPIQRFPNHVDVNDLFRFVFRIFVQIDEREMSVIDGWKTFGPS